METLETSVGIRKFRENKNLTQADLAKILKIDQTSISNWEKGKNPPTFKQANKLIEMGIPVEWLFGVDYEKIHGYTKIEATNNDLLLQILKKLALVESDVSDLKGLKKHQAARAG